MKNRPGNLKKSTRGGSRTHEPEGPELEPDAFDHSATRVYVGRKEVPVSIYFRILALYKEVRPTLQRSSSSALQQGTSNAISVSRAAF